MVAELTRVVEAAIKKYMWYQSGEDMRGFHNIENGIIRVQAPNGFIYEITISSYYGNIDDPA